MSTIDWLVLLAGAATIAWINWYFFLAGRSRLAAAAPAGGDTGVQEVRIEVRGGYSPAAVKVRRGEPVRLVFDRRETSGCSEEVVIPDLGVKRFLPAFEETVVEFTPEAVGTHEFTCGMGMLRGRIVVE